MAYEPSWDEVFTQRPRPVVAPQPPAAPEPTELDSFAQLFGAPHDESTPLAAAPPESAPHSRREARERRQRSGGDGPRSRDRSGGGGDGPKRRNLLWLKILLPVVLLLGIPGVVTAYGWFNYNEQVRELLGIPLPTDYEGSGNGEEAIVTVRTGDIGSDVARELHDAGVTMTYAAVYDYLVDNPDVGFLPGNWRLQKMMSAETAVAALQDSTNKVTDRLLLREGITLPSVIEIISETTSIPLADVEAASLDLASFGLPPEAPTLEGYLYPATYELDGTETAQGILQRLVTETFTRLDAAGVTVADRHRVLTLAALIQKEGGPESDFAKVSRVFTNRLEDGMLLQSDATVSYGAGSTSIFTTDAERADAGNPYNTYANPGLPVGPISAPGAAAIDAALNPVDGPWLFFVLVNGETGETVFSTSVEEHEAAVSVWQQWLRDNPDWNTGE